MTSISEQIRSRQDFSYNTKVFYKKHTWRIAFYQPEWREENKDKIQDAWYRNRKICEYLREKEKPSWKTRADRRFYVAKKNKKYLKTCKTFVLTVLKQVLIN